MMNGAMNGMKEFTNTMNNIHEIFPTPIYVNEPRIEEVFLVQKELDKKLEKLFKSELSQPPGRETKLKSNIHTQNNMIVEYGLDNLADYIIKHAKNYLLQTKAWMRDNTVLELGGSWTNVYDNGDAQEWHNHGDAFISGCYYYKANGINGDIGFKRSCPFMRKGDFPNGDEYKTDLYYAPKDGVLLLFPSWLDHKVLTNTTDQRRIVIAFDFYLNSPNSDAKYIVKM